MEVVDVSASGVSSFLKKRAVTSMFVGEEEQGYFALVGDGRSEYAISSQTLLF